MRFIAGFFHFWYDFIVGDAWDIAAGIVVVIVLGALVARADVLPEQQLALLVGAGIVAVVGSSLFFEARRRDGAS
jgi:hypothetical protein